MRLEFSGQIFGNITMSNLFKIRPVGVELFHRMEGQTDRRMTKLIVALRNFTNALQGTHLNTERYMRLC